MKRLIFSWLSATALSLAAIPALADTLHGTNVDLDYFGPAVTAVSSTGNSFTFSLDSTYAPNGDGTPYILRNLFSVHAHSGYALTGDVDFDTTMSYTVPDAVSSAGVSAGLDVLKPHCPTTCGPFDSDLIGSGFANAFVTDPAAGSGSANGHISITSAAGSYDYLLFNMVSNFTLDPLTGTVRLSSFTLGFDTAPAPVPELPPAAMLGAGLAVIGLSQRLKRRKV